MQQLAGEDRERHKTSIKGQHYLALDALRGVAAMVVVLGHQYYAGLGGTHIFHHSATAVDFFFILSGFVLAKAYGGALRDRRLTVRRFVIKRVIRLYPLLWLGIALGAFVAAFHLRWDVLLRQIGFGLLPAPSFSQTADTVIPLNPPAWSLFFEIVGGIAFAFTVPKMSNRVLAAVVGVSALLFALVIFTQPSNAGSSLSNFGGGFVRITFGLTAGAFLFRLHEQFPPRRTSLAGAAALVGLLLVCFAIPDAHSYEAVLTTFVAIGLCPTIVWFLADFRIPRRVEWLAELSGDLSYPIYILHWPIFIGSLAVLGHHNLKPIGDLAWLRGVIILGVVAFSYVALQLDVRVRESLSRRFDKRVSKATLNDLAEAARAPS